MLSRLIFCLCLSVFASAQRRHSPVPTNDEAEKIIPPTPKMTGEMLKADHEANLRDLEKMARLVADLQADARRNAQYAISLESVRNLEQVEKLSRGIRARMRRQ